MGARGNSGVILSQLWRGFAHGLDGTKEIDAASLARPVDTLLRVFSMPLVWLGLACYGVTALLWLVILSRLDLSYAYPVVCSSVLLVAFFSGLFLGETITIRTWCATALILVGLVLLASAAGARADEITGYLELVATESTARASASRCECAERWPAGAIATERR